MKKKRPFRRVVAAVHNTVWAIHPGKLREITSLLDLRSQGMRLTREEITARIGTPNAKPTATRQGRVAVLNIFGVMAPRLSAMQDISGGVSAEAVSRAFDAAVKDPDVSAIVLNIDSPGGAVGGIQELSQQIFNARGTKPIKTVANNQMASAALWVGTAADEVIAQPSATDIGSYGVITVHTDDTAAMEKEGLKQTVIASTEFKGEGWGPMTDGLKARMKERVDAISAQFGADLARNMGVSIAKVNADFGKGRSLLAAEALAAGMVHRIATLDTVLAELGVVAESGVSNATTGAAQPANRIGAATTPQGGIMSFEQWCLSHGRDASKFDAGQLAMMRGLFEAMVKGDKIDPLSIKGRIDSIFGQAGQMILQTATPLQGQVLQTQQTVPGGVSASDIMAQVQLTALSADAKLALIQTLSKEADKLTFSAMLDKVNAAVVAASPALGATVITAEASEVDKFHASARDAVLVRTLGASNLPAQIYDMRSQGFTAWKPSTTRDYQLSSLPRLAEQCLVCAGVPLERVRQLAVADVARIVMGADLRQFGIMAGSGAYNVTGMFSNIFYDATNVLLRRSYTEANTTFQVWAKQGQSLTDFKPVHKVIAGELSDPKAIPEDGEFEETTTTDSRESYKLTVWGEVWSQSWQSIVNDALGAFTDIPMKQGKAMRRKQNKLVYGVLKDNANLSDGGALFNSTALATGGGHNNLETGAGAPSVATLNTLTAKMQVMTGLNVADRTTLNLLPKWLLAPPVMRGTVLELLGSTSNPAASNANVKNIWENGLSPVLDAELSTAAGGSDLAWYVAADNGDVDTVEYAYLQGLEAPAFDSMMTFDRLGMKQRVYQAFAVKALDFRGLQKHAGQ